MDLPQQRDRPVKHFQEQVCTGLASLGSAAQGRGQRAQRGQNGQRFATWRKASLIVVGPRTQGEATPNHS
eukprot:4187969-Alexandrium_andersonii.AAC.1